MTIDLDREDVTLLAQALERHVAIVQDELAHTESFPMQRELHVHIERLERVLAKVRHGAIVGRTENA